MKKKRNSLPIVMWAGSSFVLFVSLLLGSIAIGMGLVPYAGLVIPIIVAFIFAYTIACGCYIYVVFSSGFKVDGNTKLLHQEFFARPISMFAIYSNKLFVRHLESYSVIEIEIPLEDVISAKPGESFFTKRRIVIGFNDSIRDKQQIAIYSRQPNLVTSLLK